MGSSSSEDLRGAVAGKPVVGIPRALLFHEYSAFWQTFLGSLGVSFTVSEETNARILDIGTSLSVYESCLPVKVFHGHVQSLVGKAEWILIPRVVSVAAREYTCPKLLGLPDMVREHMSASGQQILDVTVDMYHRYSNLFRACSQAARYFGKDGVAAAFAMAKACKAQRDENRTARSGRPSEEPGRDRLSVGVLGHRYLTRDEGLNLGLIRHLTACGVERLVTEDQVPGSAISAAADELPKHLFWTYEKRVVGMALHLIRRRLVSGLIQLASFGCGPDSMVSTIIESYARRAKMPYMMLMMDEHTGEAGVLTRVQAFADMLQWKALRSN